MAAAWTGSYRLQVQLRIFLEPVEPPDGYLLMEAVLFQFSRKPQFITAGDVKASILISVDIISAALCEPHRKVNIFLRNFRNSNPGIPAQRFSRARKLFAIANY